MIYRATSILDNYFTQENVKHRLEATEKLSQIVCGVQGKDNRIATVQFISTGDTLDLAVRVYNFNGMKSDEMSRRAILRTCNSLNMKYRFAKFLLDKDDTINIEYDMPQETNEENLGPMCKEIFFRLMSIMDQAYTAFDDMTLV